MTSGRGAWHVLRAACGACAGVFAAAAMVSASCAVPGFELVDGTTATTSTGGAAAGGGGAGGSSGGAPGCVHKTWPDPPQAGDPGPDDVEIVAAWRSMDFGEGDLKGGPKIGYDLDGRCTCPGGGTGGEGQSCKVPAWATDDHCDGPGGIDNSAAEIFDKAVVFDEDVSSAKQTERAEAGEWSLLVRIRGYNGQSNDTEVVVAIHPSPGVASQPCADPDLAANWDGNDVWPIDKTSLEPPAGGEGGAGGGCAGEALTGYDLDKPLYVDEHGYVRDGVVVANLPKAGILLSGGTNGSMLKLTAGFLTAHLVDDGGWHLESGILTGRWEVAELFRTLSTLVSGGEPLCTDHAIYKLVKNAVCTYPDIASALGGPTTPCDAVSFAIGFAAAPAQLGAVVESTSENPSCPPDTDPATDSCEAS